MNGYEKMIRLRRMKVLKIVSTVTALSMAAASLVIAASADEADADKIAQALGDLTMYGIVVDTFDGSNNSDFESNFAVNHFIRGARFTAAYYADAASRTIDFTISTDIPGEQTYYYAIYVNGTGELISGNYVNKDGVTVSSAVLEVPFTDKGTKTFTVTVPNDNKYDELIVHALEKDTATNTYKIIDGDQGTVLKAGATSSNELKNMANTSIIASTLSANASHFFGSDKVLYVGSELYSKLGYNAQDDRWYLTSDTETQDEWVWNEETQETEVIQVPKKTEISERGTVIAQLDDDDEVNDLLDRVDDVSDLISGFKKTNVNDKVILISITGSSYKGSENDSYVAKYMDKIKKNPDYILVVNVTIDGSYNLYEFGDFYPQIDTRDVDTASRIIFNFIGAKSPEETTIAIGNGFVGTVIAPNATVKNVSTVLGAVYASDFVLGGDEIHFAPYRYDALLNEYIDGHGVGESTSKETTEASTVPEETTEASTVPETSTEPEETTVESIEVSTTAPEETTVESTEASTVPEETTVESTEASTTVPEETTVESTEVSTTVPEETTVESTEASTTVPEETTVESIEVSTTVPEETTVESIEVSTTVPEETTVESTDASTVPEVTTEATVQTEETALSSQTTPATTTTPVTTTGSIVTTTPVTTTGSIVTTTPVTTTGSIVTTTPVTTTGSVAITTPLSTTTPVTTVSTPLTTTSATIVTTTPSSAANTTTQPLVENSTTSPSEPSDDYTDVTTFDITSDVTSDTPLSVDVPYESDDLPESEDPPAEAVVTTTVLINIPEDDIPLSELIIIDDEDIPLGDLPINTGVDNSVMLFIIVGGAALVLGVGAQAYTVILKKKH